MTREELTEKMKDLPNPLSRVHLIQQVWKIMNDENEQLNKENGKLEGFLEDEKMEYYELENFKNNEIKELKDKTKKIIEYLLDYPYHTREEDFMQHIKETEDFLKELEND
jgi:regulator of replication initiation timing